MTVSGRRESEVLDEAFVRRLTRILSAIAHSLSVSDGPVSRIEHALDVLSLLVPYDRCALYWADGPDDSKVVLLPASRGWMPAERQLMKERLARLHRQLSGDEPEGAVSPRQGGVSHLAIPLVAPDTIEGILLLERDEEDAYDTRSLALLTPVAAHLATYLANQRLRAKEERARAELARASEFQQLLMAIVGHDLRSPLMAITFAAEILRKSDREPREAKVVARVLSSSKRAAKIVTDLLDLSRTSMPMSPAHVDLLAVTQEVVEEARAAHPDRTIDLDLRNSQPLHGYWDPDRLSQALGNLVANAIEHGHSAKPVQVSVVQRSSTHVLVEVRNHGAPIPEDALPNLFDPFKRTKRSAKGLGLGLFIVQEIVRAHRGEVTVRSSESEGTVFTIALPVGRS